MFTEGFIQYLTYMFTMTENVIKVVLIFFINNLVAKAPGLNFGKKISNLLTNREALNK